MKFTKFSKYIWFLSVLFVCSANAQQTVDEDYQAVIDSVYKLSESLRADSNFPKVDFNIEAIEVERIMMELTEKYKDSVIRGVVYLESAYFHLRLHQQEIAKDYFLKAKAVFKENSDYKRVLETLEGLLILFSHRIGERDNKEAVIKEAIALKDKLTGYEFLGILKETTVYYSYDIEDHKKAADYAELFFNQLDSLNKIYSHDKEFVKFRDYSAPYVSLNMARSYTELGEFKKARKQLKIIENHFSKWGGLLENHTVYNYYLGYFSKLNNKDSAAYYQNKYFKANKAYLHSILDDLQQSGKFEKDLENTQKDLEILQIKTKNELENIKLIHTINRLVIAIGIIMLMFLVYVFVSSFKLKRFNKALSETRLSIESALHEKQQLVTKLDLINTSLTSDLNDNFGNRLSGLLSSIDAIKAINESADLKDNLFASFSKNLEKSLRVLTSDVKDYIWANSSQNNNIDALVKRIDAFAESVVNSYETQITVNSNLLSSKNRTLPFMWNRQLLFIAKECITNSLKYAHSDRIEVNIAMDNRTLVLTCRDYGDGFNPETLTRKSGLNNIKVRANSIGCNCTIDSNIGKGTKVTITGVVK